MKNRSLGVLAAIMLSSGASMASAQDRPAPADPLTAAIDVSDVERFAALWKKTNGQPTAAQIDAEYIKDGGPGVRGFVRTRGVSGDTIAQAIAQHRDWYDQALDKCLPWVAQSTGDLRAIYLALHGLLPERPLPQISMAIARGNTGGTAEPGMQLLGIEILCRDGSTPEKFRDVLRTFFAHETAHTFQPSDETPEQLKEPLLSHILREGGADYVAWTVTGGSPNPAREAYGRSHEAELWAQFVKDRSVASRGYSADKGYDAAGQVAFAHWLYNGNKGKLPGWETDMGYWLGMQIAKAYVEKAADPHAAIREILAIDNPADILRKSGYAERFIPAKKGTAAGAK